MCIRDRLQARPPRTDHWFTSSTIWYQPEPTKFMLWVTPIDAPVPSWKPNLVSPSSRLSASCDTFSMWAAAPAATNGEILPAVGMFHFTLAPTDQSWNDVSAEPSPSDQFQ